MARRWQVAVVAVLTALAVSFTYSGPATAATAAPQAKNHIEVELTKLASVQLAKITSDQPVPKKLGTNPPKSSGTVTAKGLPAAVAYVVWAVIVYGFPWVVRNAPRAYQVAMNWMNRRATCQELRNRGSGWGWSVFCWGT